MRWMLRDRPGFGDGVGAELDAWLSQSWEAAAAAVGRVLDVPTGKEALLASSGLPPERPAELRRHTEHPARRVTARPRWRLPLLAGGLTAGAAATAAAAVVLTSGLAAPGQPRTVGHGRTVVTTAWTVRQDTDGTVTIYLRQYADPAGLQQTLRADGINAIVRSIPYVLLTVFHHPIPQPTCQYAITDRAQLDVQRDVWTGAGQIRTLHPPAPVRFVIHPHAMPPGSALFLAFMANAPLKAGTGNMPMKPVVLTNDTVPVCVPVPIKPGPASAPKPQPTFPPASKP
jgi:hypothetical protein